MLSFRRFLFSCALILYAVPSPAQNEVTLAASKDNTLYESSTGSLSNGSGDWLFAGRTAGNLRRRALIAFDVAGTIPGGSTITLAELTLNLSKEPSGGDNPRTTSLHRVLTDWGEGTEDAGSPGGGGTAATTGTATWIHTFSNTNLWNNAGGDFESVPSASLSVDSPESYAWSSAGLAADVQRWLDDPGSNFGWIAIGDESVSMSARRFDSREHPSAPNRPSLRVVFTPPAVAVEESAEVPGVMTLRSTYPNPFSERTTITYELAEPAVATLEVYDTLGRLVESLADGWHAAGSYEATFEARGLPPGVYFFRLAAGPATTYRQAVLLR